MITAQIFCPHCGTPVSVAAACGVTRLMEAIRLQAGRFGVQAVCSRCKEGFLYSRFQPIERDQTHRDAGVDR